MALIISMASEMGGFIEVAFRSPRADRGLNNQYIAGIRPDWLPITFIKAKGSTLMLDELVAVATGVETALFAAIAFVYSCVTKSKP